MEIDKLDRRLLQGLYYGVDCLYELVSLDISG